MARKKGLKASGEALVAFRLDEDVQTAYQEFTTRIINLVLRAYTNGYHKGQLTPFVTVVKTPKGGTVSAPCAISGCQLIQANSAKAWQALAREELAKIPRTGPKKSVRPRPRTRRSKPAARARR